MRNLVSGDGGVPAKTKAHGRAGGPESPDLRYAGTDVRAAQMPRKRFAFVEQSATSVSPWMPASSSVFIGCGSAIAYG